MIALFDAISLLKEELHITRGNACALENNFGLRGLTRFEIEILFFYA